MRKSKEVRFATIASDASDMVLVGTPVVFEQPTTIYMEDGSSYTEIIHRGALDQCNLTDSTLKVNHDDAMMPLARTPKTMTLEVTEQGLLMRASLASDNPVSLATYSAVKRGDLSGMSFAFVVAENGSSYDPDTNTRHITTIAKILECSIVEHPAYPTASVEARAAITASRDESRAHAAARAERIATLARARRIINHNEIGQ